ncbi:MAG: class I SAM-dependent methyltransferase [Chloroflexi bacterium]|nr:class I SAM-dependent methyltransferase [Chloroflexota bacterium]
MWNLGWDWRRSLPHLLAPGDVVPTMRRGAGHPAWEQLRAASYPDRLVLSALACEHELKGGLLRAGITPGMRILDAACGPGVISRFLLDLGVAEVIGCDAAPEMLTMAEALPRIVGRGQHLSFERVDLTGRLPFGDAAFDAVLYGDVWLPDAFAELRRVLRPGGAIITKVTHAIASTYAWDLAFDLRVRTAQVDAYDRSTRAGAIRTTRPSPSRAPMLRRGPPSAACSSWARGGSSRSPARSSSAAHRCRRSSPSTCASPSASSAVP